MDLKDTFKKFANLGLEIHITEFDVPVDDKNELERRDRKLLSYQLFN